MLWLDEKWVFAMMYNQLTSYSSVLFKNYDLNYFIKFFQDGPNSNMVTSSFQKSKHIPNDLTFDTINQIWQVQKLIKTWIFKMATNCKAVILAVEAYLNLPLAWPHDLHKIKFQPGKHFRKQTK